MATKKAKKKASSTKSSSTKKTTASTTSAPAPSIVITREEALRTGRISAIPGHERTPAGVDAELAALPADFLRTNIPPALLDREAEEMIRHIDDASVFAARGIPVTTGHFELISLLRAKLPKDAATRDVATAAYKGYDAIEDQHAQALRAAVARLKLLCRASGLSTELVSLQGAQGNLRLMDAGRGIVARCTPHLALFSPPQEAQAQLDQIREHADAMEQLRRQQAIESGTQLVSTDSLHRVKRLLLDAMRYVGVRGEYVFADDATRLPGYQLQHISEWSNRSGKKKVDGDVVAPVVEGEG